MWKLTGVISCGISDGVYSTLDLLFEFWIWGKRHWNVFYTAVYLAGMKLGINV